MSLINDALKKAQNRHGDSTPSVPASDGPAAIPKAPRKGRTPFAKLVIVGIGISVFFTVVSVSLTWFILREEPPTPVAPPAAKIAAPPPASSPPSGAATTEPVAPASDSPVSAPDRANTAQPPIASPIIVPVIPTPPIVTPAEPAPATPAIKLSTRIQAFVDRLRVTSIRISDTGNKAILNDRLFRVNDLVEPSLGLRLTSIEPNLLTFTDETGSTYLRHF